MIDIQLTPNQDSLICIALEDRRSKLVDRIRFYETQCSDASFSSAERAEQITYARAEILEVVELLEVIRAAR
jgi:hypothetical protein